MKQHHPGYGGRGEGEAEGEEKAKRGQGAGDEEREGEEEGVHEGHRSDGAGQETPRIRQESHGDDIHPHPELDAPRATEEGRGHGLGDARNAIHSEAYVYYALFSFC